MKKNGQSIKKNFMYMFFYQALISLLPFITSPYISRILGAKQIGIYSFVYSIIVFSLLFVNLGIANYGNRIVAKNRDNNDDLNREFSSLFYLHVILSLIVLLIYVMIVLFFIKENKIIYIIQTIFIIANLLDISWLFFGEENFKSTTIKNAIVKILNCILIFLLVKRKEDLYIYTIIMTVGTLFSQLILWPFAFKYISFIKVNKYEIFKHFKKMFALFGAQLAVVIYSYMDKLMLGGMSMMAQLGFYENAWKLIEFPVGFITALGTVMLPKMSNLIAKKEHDTAEKYIKKSIQFSMMAASAICFGLLGIANEFSVIFWGNEFAESGNIIRIMSICIVLMSWNGVIRNQYLIPNEKDKEYLKAVIMAAIVNLIFNTLLIPKFGAVGAAIGTVLAYLTIFIVQNYYAKKALQLKEYFINAIPYYLIGLVMYLFIIVLNKHMPYSIINLIIKIISGGTIFISLFIMYTILVKDDFEIKKHVMRFRKEETK